MEIAIKYSLNKLNLNGINPEQFFQAVERSFLTALPLDESTLISSYHLPKHHKDPFDRLLIWTCICHRLLFLSQDSSNALYQAHGLQHIH